MLKCDIGTVHDSVWDGLTREEQACYEHGCLRARDIDALVELLATYEFLDTSSPYVVLVVTEAPIEIEASTNVQVVYATKEG